MSKDNPQLELECESCGRIGPDVEETFCPYAEEIDNEKVPATLCGSCYQTRCEDI